MGGQPGEDDTLQDAAAPRAVPRPVIDPGAETRPPAARRDPVSSDPLQDPTFASASPAQGPPTSPGERPAWLGRFVVFAELGAGGMGQIYAAYDPQLDRKVALKLVQRPPGADTDDWQRRLVREAQAMAKLSHPNVVTVHEVDATTTGQLFLVMELVEGQDLARWLAAQPRPWRAIVALFLAAGEGLAAAHAAGLVHRDFKPANVLVGDDGRVRVADFGLVHGRSARGMALRESASRSSPMLDNELTQHGAVMGTPAYMAPEQYEGDTTDERSDIFSFCVALWEALHGERPFAGDTMAERRAAIRRGAVLEPRDPNAAPRWLRPLLRRGLADDPAARWPSMRALLDALARDPEHERARRRRNALTVLAVLALGGALVYGVSLLSAALRERARQATATAHLEATLGRLEALRADGRQREADALFDAFVATPEHAGTRALVRAHRWRADGRRRAGDEPGALDAYSQAYAAADDPDDASAVLLDLAALFHERRAWAPLGWVLANLDERAPQLAARTRPLALDAALHRRDFAAAIDLAAELDPALVPILTPLTHAAASTHRARRAAVIDLEGDGTRELALWDSFGPSPRVVVTHAAAGLRTVADLQAPAGQSFDHAVDVPGDASRLVTSTTGADQAHLLVHRDGALIDEATWTAAAARSTLATDLDRDGAPEIYVGSGPYLRRLVGLRRVDAGWQPYVPAPTIDALASDIYALAVGDLDDDARPELIAGLGPWQAYDLRVLRAGAPGQPLVPVARRKLGMLEALAVLPDPEGPLIAVGKNPEPLYGSPALFPDGDHTGVPAGIYLFRLAGTTLEQVAFTPIEPTWRVGGLTVADLAGDGTRTLLADLVSIGTLGRMLALVRRDGDRLEHRRIGQLALLAVADLDDDPADELVVADTAEQDRVWTLGLGDRSLPTLDLGRPRTPAPAPAALAGEPLLHSQWDHASELAGLGLLTAAGHRFTDLARSLPHGEARGLALAQAAALAEDAGDQALAAARYEEASGSAADPRLRERAADSYERLGRLDDAIRVLAGAADPSPSLRTRIAAHARLLASERSHAFDRPLDPAWRLPTPLALHHDPLAGHLAVDLTTPEPALSLPALVTGDPMVRVELSLAELGYGSSLGLRLRPADPGDPALTLVVYRSGSSQGAGARLYFRILPDDSTLPIPVPRPDQRLALELAHLGSLGEQRVRVSLDGAPLGEFGRRSDQRFAGPVHLELLRADPLGGPARDDPWTRVLVHRVVTRGLELAPPATDPWDETRRALVDHDGPAALAAITRALADGAPPPAELPLWRAVAFTRAGQLSAAVTELRAAVGPALTPPIDPALARLLRCEGDRFAPLLREALGPAEGTLFAATWRSTVLEDPQNPALQRALLAHPPPPASASDPEQFLPLQLARVAALVRIHDGPRAHAELAALDLGTLPRVPLARRLHRDVQLRLAALDAETGALDHAFTHLGPLTADSERELVIDILRADPGLAPLHTDPRWPALVGE